MSDPLLQPEAWTELAPSLRASATLELPAGGQRVDAHWRESVRERGFTITDPVVPTPLIARLEGGLGELRAHGVHPLFALVFDEFWQALRCFDGLARSVLGGSYGVVPVPYVNVVERGASGFPAHRDRFDGPTHHDGFPNMATLWVAITPADASRAALRVIPVGDDPLFPRAEDRPPRNVEERRQRERVVHPERAVVAEVEPGCAVLFNQAVLHWGGHNDPTSAGTRLSFAFELERVGLSSARSPRIAHDASAVTLAQRLGFIGTSILMAAGQGDHSFSEDDLGLATVLSSRVHGERFRHLWRVES